MSTGPRTVLSLVFSSGMVLRRPRAAVAATALLCRRVWQAVSPSARRPLCNASCSCVRNVSEVRGRWRVATAEPDDWGRLLADGAAPRTRRVGRTCRHGGSQTAGADPRGIHSSHGKQGLSRVKWDYFPVKELILGISLLNVKCE